MRVTVALGTDGHELSYEAPDDVKVGDEVLVQLQRWNDPYERSVAGTIVTLGTSYLGPCKSIIKVLERASVPDGEQ